VTVETWLLYLATVLVFMSTPGPSHLLMISVSLGNGFRRSLATAAGDLSANVIQMTLAGFGLAAVITTSRYGFAIVKWGGVAYLCWLGIRQIVSSFRSTAATNRPSPASLKQLWLRGFVTSAANPKAVVFFAALFPQFISPEHAVAPQVAVLGGTYLLLDACFLCAYGSGASWLSQKISGRGRRISDCIAGAGLIGAAILLGMRSSQSSG
jgi:homoserine/homoserine lactone efflux protein